MRLRLVVLATLLTGLLVVPASARAVDRTVTTSADSGAGSLRQWLVDANAGDRILIPAERGTITLTSGELVVTKSLTIRGAGRAVTVVNGNDATRVIRVDAGSLTLEELTLDDGRVTSPSSFEGGAGVAIFSTGAADRLTLTNVTVRDCDVTGDKNAAGGGGVFSDGADVAVTGSTLTNNRVDLDGPDIGSSGGGAIYSNGADEITVGGSELSGNTVEITGLSPDDNGGGAILTNGGDVLTLTSTIVRDNQVTATADAASLGGSGNAGGGVLSVSLQTTLIDSAIDENTLTVTEYEPFSTGGGGLFSNGGDVTLQDSSVSANAATVSKFANGDESQSSGGGGINLNGGELTAVDSTIADNAVTLPAASVDIDGGGGVYSNGGGWAIDGTTFSGNSVSITLAGAAEDSGGAGFYGYTTPGSSMTNSTFSGNTLQVSGSGTNIGGGGLFLWANLTGAQVTNVTIAANSSNRGAGGLFSDMPPLKNTLVANNSGGNCGFDDPRNAGYSLGHNLDSGSTCGFAATGDKVGVDPKLKPLANYGGITETHDLNDGSPALDAGSGCPAGDQRGLARPFGPACDIGSVESGSTTVAPVTTGGGGGGGGGGGSTTPTPTPPQQPIVCGGFGTILPPCLGQVPQPRPVITCGPSFGTILRSCEGLGLRFGGRPIGLDDPIPVEVGCGPSPRSARAAQLGGIAKACRVTLGVGPGGGLLGGLASQLRISGGLGALVERALGDVGSLRSMAEEIGGKSSLLSEGLVVPNGELDGLIGDVATTIPRIDEFETALTNVVLAPPGRQTALVSSAQRRGRGLFGRIAGAVGGIDRIVTPGLGEVGRGIRDLVGPFATTNGRLVDILDELGPAARQPAQGDDRRSGARAAQSGRRRISRPAARRLARKLVIARSTVTLRYGTRRTVRLKLAPWLRPHLRRARGRSISLRLSALMAQGGSVKPAARTVRVRVRR